MNIDLKEIESLVFQGKECLKLKIGNVVVWEKGQPTPTETFYLLTENGDIITTENNDRLEVEH